MSRHKHIAIPRHLGFLQPGGVGAGVDDPEQETIDHMSPNAGAKLAADKARLDAEAEKPAEEPESEPEVDPKPARK
jgi:hypothetical protein